MDLGRAKQIWNSGLDIIFPKYCIGCGAPDQFFCVSCQRDVPISNKKFKLRFHTKNGFISIPNFYIYNYSHPLISEVIKTAKHSFVPEIFQTVGQNLPRQKEVRQFLKCGKLIPIPLSNPRQRWRGFNQSQIIAKQLCKDFSCEYEELLIKSQDTLPQQNLSKKQRQTNLEGSFELQRTPDSNETLILVDDVITTGSTIIEAFKTIKRACPKAQIKAFALTHG